MKNLALILALLAPVTSMAATEAADDSSTQSCQSQGYASPNFTTVFCSFGNCNATINWSPVMISGNCDGGKRFNAYGNIYSTSAHGQCMNGFIQMMIPSQIVQFNGTCDQGTLSASPTYTQSQFASGSCNPNGTSTIQVFASTVRFNGQCSSASQE